MNYQKTSIYCTKRTGKSIGLLFDVVTNIDEPCTIGIVYKNQEDAERINIFLNEYLPVGVEYKLIKVGD